MEGDNADFDINVKWHEDETEWGISDILNID